MNVLSLCDGMSCGRIALERAGIPVKHYFASEIKDIAIKVTMENYPDTIQIGDVNKVHYEDGVLHTPNGNFETTIGLVIFGSPCQTFSVAMKKELRIGLENKEKSGLFLECYRILKEVNPKFFFMENVSRMKAEDKAFITNLMGVEPIKINSSLISAQLRESIGRIFQMLRSLKTKTYACRTFLQVVIQTVQSQGRYWLVIVAH